MSQISDAGPAGCGGGAPDHKYRKLSGKVVTNSPSQFAKSAFDVRSGVDPAVPPGPSHNFKVRRAITRRRTVRENRETVRCELLRSPAGRLRNLRRCDVAGPGEIQATIRRSANPWSPGCRSHVGTGQAGSCRSRSVSKDVEPGEVPRDRGEVGVPWRDPRSSSGRGHQMTGREKNHCS